MANEPTSGGSAIQTVSLKWELSPLPSFCICGQPEEAHSAAHSRYMPQVLGPALTWEDDELFHATSSCFPSRLYDFICDPPQPFGPPTHVCCNHQCAFYYILPGGGRGECARYLSTLFLQTFAAWFHHGKHDFETPGFLTKFITTRDYPQLEGMRVGFCREKTTRQLRELVGMHKLLCQKVDEENREKRALAVRRGVLRGNHDHKLLPSFRNHFLIANLWLEPREAVTLVKIGTKRMDEPGWVFEEEAGASWWQGALGQLLEILLRETGLPPSDYPEVMHGRVV